MESDRRRHVARHALAVLAEHGARGLTHRAVDQAAGLPPGSTSYYHRTRASLLEACLDELAREDEAEIAAMAAQLQVDDEEQLAAVLAGLLHRWVTTDRTRQLGRYELFLESRRHPELAQPLHHGGLAVRAAVAHVLAGLGAPDPHRRAAWLAVAVEGALFERIAGYRSSDPVDPDELLDLARWLVRGALS